MHRLNEMNRRNSTRGFVRLALAALAGIGLMAGSALEAQITSVPPVVFSSSSLLAPTNGGGSVGRVAANQRGDVFTTVSGSLIEIPAGTNTPVVLAANLNLTDGGYGAATVDSHGNVWFLAQNPATGYDDGVYIIPFVNGTYATGLNLSSTHLPACSIPIYPVTVPCYYPNIDASNFAAAYTILSDLQVDSAGDLYALSWVNCIVYCTGDTESTIVEYNATTGKALVIENNNLPNLHPGQYYGNNYEQFVVLSNGDIYAVNGINLYYSAAGSGTLATVTGFNAPSGISIDGGGNVYVTDTGDDRIAVLPNINGAVTPSSAYTLLSGNVLNQPPYFPVGIDGYGTITYLATSNGNSLYRASVGGLHFGSLNVGSSSAATDLDLYFTAAETFGSFTLTGGPGTPFAAVSAATNGCVVGQSYAVGATCSLTVTYTSTATGPQSGSLQVNSSGGELIGTAFLSGSGIAPLLNVDPGTVTAIGTTWKAPSAIAVDAAGNTYVADSSTGDIYKNGSTTAIATGFSKPSAVVVDGAGNLYVGDAGNDRIVEVPYSGTAYGTSVVIQTGLSGPSGLALDAAGNLYVADSGNAKVLLFASGGSLGVGSDISPVGTSLSSSGTVLTGFTAPVAVAADNLGNVYVADSGSIIQVGIKSGITTPIAQGLKTAAAVAVDPGGNLYYADSGEQTITRVPNVGGTLNAAGSSLLNTIVATPSAIAVDSSGNVYAADAVDATVGESNRTQGTLNFGLVVVSESSQNLTATLSNDGTSSLTLPSPYDTASGANTADFAIQSTTTCANGEALAVGASCSIIANFTPTVYITENDTLTFAGTGFSGSLLLTGVGNQLIKVAFTGPSTVVYGTAASYTVTATVDGTYQANISGYNSAPPQVVITNGTGTLNLPVLGVGNYTIQLAGTDGTTSLSVTPATLDVTGVNVSRIYGTANPVFTATFSGAVNGDLFVGTGSSTATISSPAGTYPIVPSVAGPALANYTVVPTNGVLTITQAPSNVVLSFPAASDLLGTPITFNAAVTTTVTGSPTGTVTFENVTAANDITVIGTATIGASGTPGVASLTTSSLAAGTIYVVAVYNGDNNFTTASSAAAGLTVSLPSFTLAASPQVLQIVQGQSKTVTLTVTPVGNFTAAVVFSCQGMPLEASCSFASPSVSPNGGPASTTLTINTVGPSSARMKKSSPWGNMGGGVVLALAGGLFVGRRRKRFTKGLCMLLLLALVSIFPMTGCGGLDEKNFDTPLGISTVTITGSSAADTTQATAELRLAVISASTN
jgi:sugar lactone lactonase YvrE